ncbi:glutaredoxin-1 [Ornithorhynchus anatinus]|uniref:Glutaredoxin-1 n=1 Tax=Ornithorhynchus anatinus TaxID=9258 RepID=A0A6I8NRB4_ORNAN|nr:glutaredoxin-1 [Ornithorhynchus anatinus]
MAEEFVSSKLGSGLVVVFIKPTCPYCRRARELLLRYPFKPDCLRFVDITVQPDPDAIQDYLHQLTGARTVPRVFIGTRCIGGSSDLTSLDQSGQLLPQLLQIGAVQE